MIMLKVNCINLRFGGVSIKFDFVASSVAPPNFDLFQFSNNIFKKYLNRFYYNYIKVGKHKFRKVWWIYHEV